MRITLIISALCLAVGASAAKGDIIRVFDWDYFTQGATDEKLLENNRDFTDGSLVPSDGNHHFGFSYNDGSSETVCGDANNNNRNVGDVKGKYVDMAVGDKPTGLINVYDLTGDGIGDYDNATGGLALDITDDIYIAGSVFGWTPGTLLTNGKYVGGIELDGVLDNIGALPAWPDVGTSTVELPSINLIPEPLTLSILALGGAGLLLRRKR